MIHQPLPSSISVLARTLLIAGVGYVCVDLLSRGSTMSDGELLIGPISLALVWLGMSGRGRETVERHDSV